MKISDDRGVIIDFIGKHHGSPALSKEQHDPTIVMGHDDPSAIRVGWAAFFHEVEHRHLALAYDPQGDAHQWVPHALAGEELTPDSLAARLQALTHP